MTDKDSGNGAIPKSMLDWVAGVGAIATVLVSIFSQVLDNVPAQRLAYGVALILAIGSSAVFLYKRRRAERLKITVAPEPLTPSATLRGLIPFDEGDQLPGRARDVQALYTMIASSSFQFGVLWGEPGCGKTSLLQAGLMPRLRSEKFFPLYISKPTENPQEAIRAALIKEIPNLKQQADTDLQQLLRDTLPKSKKFIILFDQFEKFFLLNRTPSSLSNFTKWVEEVLANEDLPLGMLISIRADFFAQLQNFSPQIPEPTSPRTTYQLRNFDTEQAKQLLNEAAQTDAIPFEPDLIAAVVTELSPEGFIRPVELQIVGQRLNKNYILTLNKFEALGGARGIISSYINGEINRSANKKIARLILRLMYTDATDTKIPNDLSLEEIVQAIGEMEQASSEVIRAILNNFVTARVLIHTDDEKYNLVHDYLVPYVRAATQGIETYSERADRLLKRYIAEYREDPKSRIPFRHIRWIRKYASPQLKGGSSAKELMKKSTQAFSATVGGICVLVIALLVILYGYLTSISGLNPVDYFLGRDIATQENPFIELEGGEMVIGAEKPDLSSGEQPLTKIPIDTFYIQQTEVTNHQFRICRQAGGCRSGPVQTDFYNNSQYDDYPVVYVTAYQAREFCQWLGGDLPTSEQWERAARGLDGRPWPWPGDSLTPERANIFSPDTNSSDILAVRSYDSGATSEDIHDLVGNVWEWTRTQIILQENGSVYSVYVWNGTEKEARLLERGGSWASYLSRITEVKHALPDYFSGRLGFRCAMSEIGSK